MKDRKERVKEAISILSDNVAEYMRQAYDEGYRAAQDKHDADGNYKDGYSDGLMHAWNCAKELYQMCASQRAEVLNSEDITMREVLDMEPEKAVAAINEWKKKKDEKRIFKVGDEVYYLDKNYPSVVTAIAYGDDAIMVTQSGKWSCVPISKLHKTGKYYPQIEEVLKGLRGE